MTSDLEAASFADASSEYQCSLCNKIFSRRDLRNRHRRRCEKSIGKPRPSKKRSCEACGKSKLKCDLAHPACSRCTSRGIPCEYPPETVIPLPARSSSQASYSSLLGHEVSLTSDVSLNHAVSQAFQPSTISSILHPSYYAQAHIDTLSGDGADMYDCSMEGLLYTSTGGDDNTYSQTIHPSWDPTGLSHVLGESNTHATGMMTETTYSESVDFPQSYFESQTSINDVGMPLDAQDMDNTENSLFPTMSNNVSYMGDMNRVDMNNDYRRYSTLSMQYRQNKSYLDRPAEIMSMPTSHTRSNSLVTPSTSNSSNMGHELSPASSNTTYSTNQSMSQTSLPMSRSVSANQPNELFSKFYNLRQPKVMSAEDATSMICDFPRQMLNIEHWSPFIHHKLYRYSEGGLSEPVAIALCCVSANLHRVESSIPFVCSMIHEQRSKLINEFPRKDMSLAETCSSLLALCIYQIESLLALRHRQPLDETLSGAEYHQQFLPRITRVICRNNQKLLRTVDNNAIEWRTWQIAETLRRTVSLANMVNDLCFTQNAIHPQYYEPIDESSYLDMPLPAPESMWKAIGPVEWQAARDSTKWTNSGVVTIRQAVDNLKKGMTFGGAHPLQELVVSCAWRRAGTAFSRFN